MLNRGWVGKLLCAVIVSMAARVATAQESQAAGEEVRDLKRRLEILEKEKAERDAKNSATPAVQLMDPAEEKWYDRVKVGGGVRATFRTVTKDAPNGHDASTDFALESGRLYTGGKITDFLSATLNAEFTSGSAAVLDAIAQFKVSDEFNIFVGRMLPATDRSNSDGPYYLATWDFPFLSDGFNATGKLGDRDDGITLWGDIGHFKYWVGAYEGSERAPGVNVHDALLYAARVQYDFMDPETGYYLTSTYYGDKKVLAVGLVANYQSNAAGPNGNPVGFGNIALDFLWEQKLDFLGDGVATVEAAYYYFGRHGFNAGNPPGPFDVGAGNGFLFLVAYLIPGKLGWGQLQPHIRYQGFDEVETSPRNPTASNEARWDIGVNYVMSGHNARVSMVYTHRGFSGPSKEGMFTIGTQFQF
jgi:hypothetical protein